MKKINVYRHGEICLVPIKELPIGLTLSKTKTIMEGSTGNGHKISKGKLYLKKINDYVFGYLVADNTKLLHLEHGDKKVGEYKTATLPDGIYELRRALEKAPDGLKPVVD